MDKRKTELEQLLTLRLHNFFVSGMSQITMEMLMEKAHSTTAGSNLLREYGEDALKNVVEKFYEDNKMFF
jgi:hypothetical protein